MENSPAPIPRLPILDGLRFLVDDLMDEDLLGRRLPTQQVQKLLANLPRIHEKELVDMGESDSSCSICFAPYLTILTEEEMALAMDSPAHPAEELGVTKLSQAWQCGHLFCRRDITKWITSGHPSCPMCRRLLIEDINEIESVSEDAEGRAQERPLASAFLDAQMRDMETLLRESGVEVRPETLNLSQYFSYPPANLMESDNHRQELSGMYS
ncbi:hypothetical protein M413DRAFT_441298 [Hebeloma cylindrosporum]|uniref:RING-type domain-containing protein n=1 Tax=Hebeloma cylindrosporum TaxID=76867 RepID=A0A0C3CBR0_HEBCY|nr:hypothetical protein M413DRAFT_441298 [Hebeloma cylindrosporum h7]